MCKAPERLSRFIFNFLNTALQNRFWNMSFFQGIFKIRQEAQKTD